MNAAELQPTKELWKSIMKKKQLKRVQLGYVKNAKLN
jgi:hypothetical protein